MIGLDGFELEPIGTKIMQFIKKISQTETFIIVCILFVVYY